MVRDTGLVDGSRSIAQRQRPAGLDEGDQESPLAPERLKWCEFPLRTAAARPAPGKRRETRSLVLVTL